MSLLIAFSGQGAQHSKMMNILQTDSYGKAWLKDASDLLRLDLFDEVVIEQACSDPILVQTLIMILSLGIFYALKKQIKLEPEFLCGYSLGEASAFCASAHLSLERVCDLVTNRAQFMQQACKQASGLAVLKGRINWQTVNELAITHGCFIAIINADDHYIVGGLQKGLDELLKQARELGVVTVGQLMVKLASHTPLLTGATDNFAAFLECFNSAIMHYPILNALTQEVIFNSTAMLPILARELSETLHWNRVLQIAKEYQCSFFLEIGPGSALKKMVHDYLPQMKAYSTENFSSMVGLIEFLKKYLDLLR